MIFSTEGGRMRDCLKASFSILCCVPGFKFTRWNQNQIISFCVDHTNTLQNPFGDNSSCSLEKSRSLFSSSSDFDFLTFSRLDNFCHYYSGISSVISSLWFSSYTRSDQLTYVPPHLSWCLYTWPGNETWIVAELAPALTCTDTRAYTHSQVYNNLHVDRL